MVATNRNPSISYQADGKMGQKRNSGMNGGVLTPNNFIHEDMNQTNVVAKNKFLSNRHQTIDSNDASTNFKISSYIYNN